jgi:mandelate racemase
MQVAALAEINGLPLSSHIAPELSAHLLAASPTAHWLEFHEWVRPLLQEPLAMRDGLVTPSGAPGAGILWDEAAVRRCLVA